MKRRSMIAEVLAGLVLGYVGSIPAAGPLALLVVASGVERDIPRGVRLAVGGAAAESLYALIAVWGVSGALPRYPALYPAARAAGAVLLALLGVALLRRARAGEPRKQLPRRYGDALLGFSLVALNPAFLVTWTGFAALLSSFTPMTPGPLRAPAVALGAFIGIVGWFTTLLVVVRRRSVRWSSRAQAAILGVTGGALILMSAWLVIDAVRRAL